MSKIALVTGATRNLGFSLAEGLAQRLEPTDTVYLTGRDSARVTESVHRLSNTRAEVRGELLDVAKPGAVERFADVLAERHGGVDIVFFNHYTRVQPDDDPPAVIESISRPTIWARPVFCEASLPCSATVGGCLWWRAAPAACARWRQHCIRGSKTCNRSTMSTARFAVGATRCAPVARQVKRGRPGSIFRPKSVRSRQCAWSRTNVAPTICAEEF